MALTPLQAALSIGVMALVTVLTRILPFILFDRGGSPPKVILYLGRWLPPAVIAMLIVYCLRHIHLSTGSHGLPEFLAIAAVVALHLWKRSNLLSIFGGTAFYMLLVQLIFV